MYPEIQLLGRWTRSAATLGTQDPNTVWSPPTILTNNPQLPQGQLTDRQVGAAAYLVIEPPQSGTTYESLDRVALVLDGTEYPLVWYDGTKPTLTAPNPRKVRYGQIIWLGQPPYTQETGPAAPLDNTAPKFINSVSVNCYAGNTAITTDYTVEVWGWVYDSVKLASLMPTYGGANITMTDESTGATFTVVVPTISAAGDWRGAWTSLPAGPQQGGGNGTPIYPFLRRARNANPTTVNTAYIPEYQNSSQSPAVEHAHDNLYFQLNARQALLITAWGVNGPLAPNSGGYDLYAAWIDTPSEAGHPRHPRGGRPAQYQDSTTRFGLLAGASDRYAGIPQLDTPVLVTNETAYLTFVDNGVSIPALQVTMALSGILLGPTGQGGV
jgi:hypothetical protein